MHHTYTDALNEHMVCLKTTNAAGCISETCKIISTAGDFKVRLSEFKVYPNPTKTILSIQGKEIDHIIIINSSGQILWREEIKGVEDSTIDLGLLPNGLYIIEVIGKDGKVYREKIVKN